MTQNPGDFDLFPEEARMRDIAASALGMGGPGEPGSIDATNILDGDAVFAALRESDSLGPSPAFAAPAAQPPAYLPPSLEDFVAAAVNAVATMPVGKFFERVDWTGSRVAFAPPPRVAPAGDDPWTATMAMAEAPNLAQSSGPASLSAISVAKFFGAVRWDGSGSKLGAVGTPAAAPAPAAASSRPDEVASAKENEIKSSVAGVFDDFTW